MTPEAALQLAYDWARRGVPAFPIAISWDDKKHATNKVPLCKHGHRDAEADCGTVLRLFQEARRLQPGEELGVGLWPGPANRVVLDVDDKHGLRGSDELDALEAEHGRLPDHAIVLTPSGGCHRWLRKPPGVHVGNADLAPGINVRADDGWVVAPGTTTTWGSWEGTLAPAPLWPEWLAAKLTGVRNGQAKGRWGKLDRDTLDPRDRAALESLEALGGHDPYLGGDGAVLITRPGKAAGASASIGYIGPGIVNVFTDNWAKLKQEVYDADGLAAIAASDGGAGQDGPREPPGIVMRRLADVESERVSFLWGDRLPIGKLSALGGQPGLGKSYLTEAIAADVSAGRPLPGDPFDRTHEPGDVLIASFEDGAGDTLRPRAEKLHGDLKRMHVIEGTRLADGKTIRPFGPADVAPLGQALKQLDNPKLLIIDPVGAWVGSQVNAHRDNEVRGALEGIRKLAEEHKIVVLLVMHITKASAPTALARLLGSGAWGGVVRSVLMVGPLPDDDTKCAVAHVKHNLSAKNPTLGFHIDGGGFQWDGVVEDLDGEQLVGHDDEDRREKRSALAEACDFLTSMLADGPRLAEDMVQEAKLAGIAEKTLRRAKKKRGVISKRDGWGGKQYWHLHHRDGQPPPPGARYAQGYDIF